MQAEFAEFTAPSGPRQLSVVPSSSSHSVMSPVLASLLPSTFWVFSCHHPTPAHVSPSLLWPVGTHEPDGGGYQWWRAQWFLLPPEWPQRVRWR